MAFTESRSRIAQAAAEAEATYGINPVIDGAQDGFNTFDSAVAWNADVDSFEFRPHGPSFTRQKNLMGRQLARINFNFLIQGSGTAGTAVQGINDVFGSSGWKETLVAVTSATYAPATIAQLASATIQTAHTMLHTATGCYGDLNITATAGREMRATYTGQGLYSAPTIGSIGTWSVGTTGVNRAIAYKGVTGTIANGVDAWATPTVQSFTFRAGNDIRQIPDAFSATGLKKLFFADRNPTAEIVFALDTDTTGVIIQADEFYTNWLASTTWDVQLVHGATAGNINTFNADAAQVVNVQEGEGDGFRTLTASLKLQASTAEAEYSLVQT